MTFAAAEPVSLADSGARVVTIAEAVQVALDNYPSINAAVAQAQAAKRGISLARTAYLPRLDTTYQEVRGSSNPTNNIYYPLMDLPLVVTPDTNRRDFGRSVWSATAGAVFNWELIDFGLRRARVRAAQAQHLQSETGVALTRFDVGVAAADAYFAVIAAEQKVRAERANVERFRVFTEAVYALVRSDLRAGVDASRADAELARARDLLIQAEQNRDVAKAILAERMGIASASVDVVQQPFLTLPQYYSMPPMMRPFEFHPLALQNAAIINTVGAREKAISREWFPHISALAAIQSRGSGMNRGSSLTREGFLPDVPNWMVGMVATFPIMDVFQIRIRQRIEQDQQRAARARYAETMQILQGQDAVARAEIVGAQRRADNAPSFLKAAQDTVKRAQIRYNVGLGNVVEVAEAERLLTDAQVISDLASIGVWRAYLAAAVAHGDLAPFLKLVADASPR
jgi:outer membrane protein TolC